MQLSATFLWCQPLLNIFGALTHAVPRLGALIADFVGRRGFSFVEYHAVPAVKGSEGFAKLVGAIRPAERDLLSSARVQAVA